MRQGKSNATISLENEQQQKMQLKGDVIMLVVTMLWGSSYLFMKMGLHTMEGFNIVGLRFFIAFIVSGALFYKRFKQVNLETLKYGFILGFIIFATMSSVTIGVEFTSVSNAGFLFSLAVVFVPLLLAIFYKQIPDVKIVIGVLLAVTGIALLTLNSGLQINNGDILVIAGALLYAVYILITDKAIKKGDAMNLGISQLGFAGAFGLFFSLLFEKNTQLPSTTEGWIAILALSIFCSAIGFIGQTIAQQYTTPTRTGLIFSLEPVFAALFAFIFIGEVLSAKGYVGAILVLIGVLATKINFSLFIPEQLKAMLQNRRSTSN